ncbi:hypothetical protein HKX48_000858 [Thoreauomyces humboldtii]|nr:hypothetical protein HKX48_000858 [Thoreauomyces humboldtii]
MSSIRAMLLKRLQERKASLCTASFYPATRSFTSSASCRAWAHQKKTAPVPARDQPPSQAGQSNRSGTDGSDNSRKPSQQDPSSERNVQSETRPTPSRQGSAGPRNDDSRRQQLEGRPQNGEARSGFGSKRTESHTSSSREGPSREDRSVSRTYEKDTSGFRPDRKASSGSYGKPGSGKDRDREKRDRASGKSTSFKRDAPAKRNNKPVEVVPKDLYIGEGVSVANLSTLMGVTYPILTRKMKRLGLENTEPDYVLHCEMASLIALEFGMNPIVSVAPEADITARPEPEDWSSYPSRPPVVTIMGHVDHGKTTLLDSLRMTSVASGEAGGITQHIGAFSVLLPSQKRITFLDTPGHAAFSAMRQRGAQCTDIVVLVVAADDGVMPQTVEAIKHSLNANVPIIVAINKCDKPDVNTRKIKEGLLRYDVVLEEFGGEIPAVEVSGLTGKGLDELEETIVTLAEVLDIRGDSTGAVEGVVVESKLVRGKGNVATVLVRRGKLTPGTVVVAGNSWSKVRVMHDEHGEEVLEAGPSLPVEVMGWRELPAAGDEVLGIDIETARSIIGDPRKDAEKAVLDAAKKVVDGRVERARREQAIADIGLLNEKRMKEKQDRADEKEKDPKDSVDAASTVKEPTIPVLNILLKADVHGSLEALSDAIGGLPAHEARCVITGSGVGSVTDSDVDTAVATKSTIIAFNLATDKRTQSRAVAAGVDIKSHQIIYRLLDDLKDMLSDLLPPDIIIEVNGEAEILQVFNINVKAKILESIAGCRISTGKVMRSNLVRVVRDGKVVYDGKLKTFRHHKKDINEGSKGLECGMGFEGFEGFQEGDVVQAYTRTEKRRTIS